jgi:hypothetical protein
MSIFAIYREAKLIAAKKKAEQIDRSERAGIAKAFNDRYTYRREWVAGMDYVPGEGVFGLRVRGGYAWMCPECNKIHHPVKMTVFTGLQYPACCATFAGHRLHESIKYNDKGNR